MSLWKGNLLFWKRPFSILALHWCMIVKFGRRKHNIGNQNMVVIYMIPGEKYDDWVKSFPKNVKVNQHLGRFRRMSRWTLHPINLLRRKSRTPNFSQTAVNCLLRKTATMREMKSSPVLCIYYTVHECENHTH